MPGYVNTQICSKPMDGDVRGPRDLLTLFFSKLFSKCLCLCPQIDAAIILVREIPYCRE